MIKNRDIKVLTELLDLEGVKVRAQRIHDGIGIILKTESIKSYSICPRCGTKSEKLHQNHSHIIKDLPFGEKPVFLEINRRQFKCSKCQKPFSEDLDYAKKKRTYTKRLASKIIQDVLESDIHTVASKGVVTTEEIERMLKDASEELCDSQPSNLKRLEIDEIALVKGKGHYCAVLIDLDTSKLLAILNGRTQEIIKKTLIEWGDEVLIQIEEVSIDLWQGYKNLVTELMSKAQVVADRFHVMTQINKELDTQRKTARRSVEELIKKAKSLEEKAEYEIMLSGLKNSKYSLLKNEDNLTEEQVIKLIEVKKVSPVLKDMHDLKEKIRKIFNRTNDWYTNSSSKKWGRLY